MAYVIIFYDKHGVTDLRNQLRPAHIDYMKANLHRILASGGLLSDDGESAHGGVMILDTDSRAETEAFVAEDPFFIGGVYTYIISRWRKAFLDRKSYLP